MPKNYADKIIALAKKEIGQSHVCFVKSCFERAFGTSEAHRICGNCSIDYYKNNRQFYTEPKDGDQIFLFGMTGIVEHVSRDFICVIQCDDIVHREFYALSNENIIGYGRPLYDVENDTPCMQTKNDVLQWLMLFDKNVDVAWRIAANQLINGVFDVDFDVERWRNVRRGAKGPESKIVQAALIYMGYDCGLKGADGCFGKESVKALKKFQKDNNLIQDGVAGKYVFLKLI